eukprot:TRINITY_DN7491_c0_g1_i1.p1 TRINITY_DN7491_c0_g1~~TRINITY_DN7491_c0_g1_i1.p1  ORF type:complete len:218 (-),score=39.49 TRINITY_DN7491_c0_g1_i1:66-677(-)
MSSTTTPDSSSTAQSATKYMLQPLFGGAMQVALPTTLDDVSRVRQVPDHQEAFTEVSTDRSVIVELLAYDADVSDEDAGKHYFTELAETNKATAATITHQLPVDAANVPEIASEAPVCRFVRGTQSVAKFREQATNEIDVYMAVVRMPGHSTDLLVSQSVPRSIAIDSSSAQTAQAPLDDTRAATDFAAMIGSIKLNDPGLFA